ncbi:hypothetical protein WA026_008873, partial [Henosepilachna vigintioctopunctata]
FHKEKGFQMFKLGKRIEPTYLRCGTNMFEEFFGIHKTLSLKLKENHQQKPFVEGNNMTEKIRIKLK